VNRCGYCNSLIIAGGARMDGATYCDNDCLALGSMVSLSMRLDPDEVARAVDSIFKGSCPECQGTGPVEAYSSHRVWSIGLMTRWTTMPHVCCRKCAIKHGAKGLLFSGVLGWWGIPWGIVMTPVQIARNIAMMVRSRPGDAPSLRLENLVRLGLVRRGGAKPTCPVRPPPDT